MNPFAGIPVTILELDLPGDTVWAKCEECTKKMVEATRKHKKGFFAQLKLIHTKYHRKEDFYKNKYFIPAVSTFKDGEKMLGTMRCSSNVGSMMERAIHLEPYNQQQIWNEHGFTGVTDSSVIIMDRNYHFGHLHRMDIPPFAKYTSEDESKELELLDKYAGEGNG
tara:strand:+ start:325 stop:822 length:498 start_codon:yes stop_codon:yes gene_type:complete